MLNIRISHCTDGVEKVIEISDKDVAVALQSTPARVSDQRFTDNGDGTVTDNSTGLTWTKDNVGTGKMDHAAGVKACKDLKLADRKWDLPTRAELLSLVDDMHYRPAIDSNAFPDIKSDWYWSSTPTAWDESCAWFVDFGLGLAYYLHRSSEAFVRAVSRASAGQ